MSGCFTPLYPGYRFHAGTSHRSALQSDSQQAGSLLGRLWRLYYFQGYGQSPQIKRRPGGLRLIPAPANKKPGKRQGNARATPVRQQGNARATPVRQQGNFEIQPWRGAAKTRAATKGRLLSFFFLLGLRAGVFPGLCGLLCSSA